jgi:enoyl-CoA hydratase/carnithine racemase
LTGHRLTRIDHGHVAELVFANGAHNHATVGLLHALGDQLAAIDEEPAIRAVVLASEGRVFCAGGDLATPGGLGSDDADPVRVFYDAAQRLFETRKPMVAAVQGAAVGAGLGLAVACDFRVAAPEARFAANFTALGFHPGFALSVTLPRLIGQQRAHGMMMTAARYRPEAVAPWGLVDRLADSGCARDMALGLAQEIAANAPLALMATRATMRAGLADAVRAALAHEHTEQQQLKDSDDYREGVSAVFERRAARFTGR